MPPNEENVDPLWPELPYADTYATLHLWTQIVGKIRLKQSPWLNHSWHVVLYVSPRGLTTSSIPYGNRTFQLDFDFLDHVLLASASDGAQREIRLIPRSVADFYADLLHSLSDIGRMRFQQPSLSVRTISTHRMTRISPSAFGAFWCNPSAC
jgi:hypothetical protein